MEIAKWDSHLKNDYVRNKIVIPYVISRIKFLNATKILDIGCGSGYLDFKFGQSMTYGNIDCIDKNRNNIEFALNNYCNSPTYRINFIHSNYFTYNPTYKYNLILVIYTLLDFKINLLFTKKIAQDIEHDGTVIIILPDFLFDLLQENDNLIINKYISGSFSLKSKSISRTYKVPFIINRIENVIELMIKSNFVLVNFIREPYEINKAVFIMEFKKNHT